MKNLITYLKTLWSWVADSQSTDVSLDCRLTVGSPSGLDAKWMLKFVSVLVLVLTVGVGNVWGYTITFTNNANSATAISSSVTATTTIASASRTYVNSSPYTVNSGNCYYGGDGKNNIRIGKSGASAGLSIALSASGQVSASTIVVNCMVMTGSKNTGATLSVNGAAAQTAPTSADNLTFTINDDITSITLSSTKAVFIYSITVNTGGGASVSTPTFSVAEGTYNSNQSVIISCATAGSTIYYTTNGTTPTSSSTAYSSAVAISSTTTLKAIAIKGGTNSSVASATYTLKCATPTFSPAAGTYGAAQSVSISTTYGTNIYYTTDGTTPTTSSTPYTSAISVSSTQTIKAIASKSGCSDSDEGSAAYTINIPYTVSFNTGTGNPTVSSSTEASGGAGITLPAGPTPACSGDGWSFAGWGYESCDDESTEPTLYIAGNKYYPESNETLYAVYVKGKTASTNYKLISDAAQIVSGENYVIAAYYNSNDYAITAEIQSSYYIKQTAVTVTENVISSPGAKIIWQLTNEGGSNVSLYNSNQSKYLYVYASGSYRNLGLYDSKKQFTMTEEREAGYASTFAFNSTDYTSYYINYDASHTDFGTKTSSDENLYLYKRQYTGTYESNPTCCTPLGSINGSVSWSNAAMAVVSWDDLAHVSSWTVKYKTHAAGEWSTAGASSASAGTRSVTISSLTPCTNYDFKIIATPDDGYCDKDQTIEDSQTHNWTVTSTGVTHATASPAIPSTTCSGFSTTISAATGYALPAEITVTNASKTWNSSTGALTISSVTGNVSITITPTCVSPVVTADPANANYYVGDDPTALSVTATLASGTRTYLWKVSTNGGSTWSDAAGTNNAATYSGASLSTASAGTLKFKCIVGNSEGGCTVESGVATITVSNASYFPNGKTIFIQAESTSAWTGGGCVKAWFHTAGGSETAQSTYWLFDATGGDAGKKLFAAVVPASGDLPYLDIQRFAANCSDWWNKNGGCSYSDANGSNAIRSTGKHDDGSDGDYIRWNASGVTIDLHGDPSGDDWASSLASFSDQGSGEWTATYNNYAPANAAGESQEFKAKTNYNGWIGNTGSNNNATLDGMHVGSTYNITATLDVTAHSLVMSKTFVKGSVHFDLQGHGLAISDLTNVAAGSKISAPSPAPSATGYTFGGWFTDPECTDEWTFASDEVNETMTLYAKWTANVYTITKTFSNVANAGLPSSFTYTGAATTALNSTFTVDATNFFLPSSIAVTMGGTPLTAGSDYTYNNSTGAFTFSRIISGNIVITASATAKLKSIAITTQPTTRKYFEGESFSSAGAVVTATMGDGSTKVVTASTTWTPPATPLAAGTGLTVTASYTENAINMTATTTIDVYSVTVNKVNEDGDAIDVAGVTATWTVGTKALAAGVGSTKYAFKQWDVTGATAASTSSASTTLSSPTANVVVNAVFWKPRTVKWSVNGNDSYNTGSPTTEVAYNGTISTVPTAPSGLVCASTFVAWTDAAHNNGTTAKASASYYGAALYTAAGDFPNITAETTTFYAVFAEGGGAAVNTVMWSEDWTGYADNAAPTSPNTGDGYGAVVYGGASIGYAWAAGTGSSSGTSKVTTANNGNLAGGTSPEAMIGKTGTGSSPKGGKLTISGILPGGADSLTLTYKQNAQGMTVSIDGTGYYLWNGSSNVSSISHNAKNTFTHPIVCGSASTFSLTFQANGNNNVRLDDIEVKVRTVTLTNYVTECDANIVSVTYDANGGSTSCTNTTTDKTEDFTVCSSAPTRDYYTFAGWLCSADDEVYAANATIDADAIDADFTLTAQWTPVTYTITYNYNGGSAQVDPVPATSYTVESSDITLQTPTKGHDRFDGWYENADLSTGGVKTTIAAGSHENKTYYAKWTARHEIIFDADGATTTIYRADDENMEDAVAGQGSVPSDPDAPTACSSKVFVGWSESTIDGETDDEPGDLMKPAAGTVDADKHYYAVWAIQSSTTGPVTVFEDALYGKAADGSTFSTYGDWDSFGYVYGCGTSTEGVRVSSKDNGGYLQLKANIGLASVDTIKFKIKSYGDTNGGKITLSSYIGAGTYDNSTSAEFTTTNTSSWEEKTCILRSADNTTDIRFEGEGSKYRIYLKDIKITKAGTVYTYSAYSTSCCATNVTLSQNSPEHGTIAFGKTKVPTCGDKEVSLTITPAAGYQLSSYEVATGSGKVATKSVSPAISLDNNSSAEQNITLTFASGANGAYDVTAAFSLMTVTSWTWTLNSAAIPDPLNLYVGQSARLDVAYTPAGVDASKKTYTRTKDDTYINFGAGAYTNYTTIIGRASTGENTTAVTFTHADGPSTTVNVKVLPLPLTHFVDLVHGKAFANVAATIEDNALSATKTTPTSDDWTTPNANPCEENHLHLVGWIREDWPALVNYLNGTGAAPTTVAITGAGNDGEGHAYYIAAGASINVQTFDGVTFYAVWSKVE